MSTTDTTLPDQTQRQLNFVSRPVVIGTVVRICIKHSQYYRTYNATYSCAQIPPPTKSLGARLHATIYLSIAIPVSCMTVGREYSNLLTSTQQGRMSTEELSVSVVRLMKAFIMLGALDPPEMVPYSK